MLERYFIEPQCDICGKKFKSIIRVIKHIRNTHDDVYESSIYLDYVLGTFYCSNVPTLSMDEALYRLINYKKRIL